MKPRAEYSTHSPTCVNPADHLSHDRTAQACDSVFTLYIVSPSTCLPNPPPYARMLSAFRRLSIMPAGWQRVATRRTAGNLLPGKCGRYTSSSHPKTARIFLERSLNALSMAGYPLQGVYRHGFRVGPLGAMQVQAAQAPATTEGSRRNSAGQHITLRSA